jgi:membrane associated rhomboid family serine protease
MTDVLDRRITPWVGRLLAANAIVLLLQQTIFTSDSLTDLLSFTASLALQRPWTFVTYMFVHAGILHLAANSLALFVFGPAVERRLGSSTFILYYLYCGIGAAFFSLLLHTVNLGPDAMVGASGAILGVAYAFSRIMPDAQLMVFPIPVPIRARWLILMLAAFDVVGLFLLNDNIAHGAHLGGLLSGAFYFVLRGIARPADPMPIASPRPRVPVAVRGSAPPAPSRTRSEAAAPQVSRESQSRRGEETAEIDRVLDKISASGIDSLTPDERRFLDAVARRRRNPD